ncbi:MAG: extracellular solute-binding protein family 1 [Clostridia bacterium]|nr:extracellular solute-binding protein family 1 [Clostridia bacterium]
MKKIITLLILLCFCLFMMSCSAAPNEEAEQENEAEEPQIDLNGISISILQPWEVISPIGYKAETLFSDLAFARFDEIEKNYNCNLELVQTTDIKGAVQSATTIGIIDGDIITEGSGVLHKMAEAELLYPLTDLKDILDYENDAKWGGANVLECLMLNSTPYGVIPYSWPQMEPAVSFVIAANNELLKAQGLPDAREHIENGTWNRDTFVEYIQKGTFGEGDSKVWGIFVQNTHWVQMALAGNEIYYVEQKDGQIVKNLDTEAGIEALQWATDTVNLNNDCFFNNFKPLSGWDGIVKPLVDRKVSMCALSMHVIYNTVIYELDDFSVLPFPVGPYGTAGKWPSIIEGATAFSIPAISENSEAAAYIINALGEPFEGYETEEKRVDYYASQIVHDRRDAELVYSMLKSSKYNYWPFGSLTFTTSVADTLLKKTPRELLDTYSKLLDECIDKYMIPNLDYMESHS